MSVTGPAAISESAGKATYTVTCGTASPLPGIVPETANTGPLTFGIADGPAPATQAEDYGTPSQTLLTCSLLVTSFTVDVPITNDTLDEQDEKFTVTASGVLTPQGAASQIVTTTITDDDPLASIAELAFIVEPDSGTQAVELTVTLASAAAQTTTIPFETDDLSATAGADYTATAGDLVFQPGETSKTVSVPVVGDTAPESAEAFFVNLVSTDNGSLSPTASQGSVGIFDNDQAPLPTVSLPGSVSVEEGNGAGNILFDVTLSSPATERTEVAWKTLEWTALNGQDYERGSGKLVFRPGQKSKTVSVDIIGDRRDEPNEAFAVTLENPVAATLGATKASFGVIEDDDGPKVGIGKPTVRGKRLVTKVSCPESATGCQGTLTGKVGKRALRRARFDLGQGEVAKLRLKLSRAIRTALAEKARRAKLSATASDPSGDTLVTTRRARLKRLR